MGGGGHDHCFHRPGRDHGDRPCRRRQHPGVDADGAAADLHQLLRGQRPCADDDGQHDDQRRHRPLLRSAGGGGFPPSARRRSRLHQPGAAEALCGAAVHGHHGGYLWAAVWAGDGGAAAALLPVAARASPCQIMPHHPCHHHPWLPCLPRRPTSSMLCRCGTLG